MLFPVTGLGARLLLSLLANNCQSCTNKSYTHLVHQVGVAFCPTIFLITMINLQEIVTTRPTAVSTRFGSSVAFSSHGNTCLVGEMYHTDTLKPHTGRVRYFVKTKTKWKLKQTIDNPEPLTDDQFGSSLSISTDNQFCAIGVRFSNKSNFADQGGVWIYHYNQTTQEWERHSLIRSPSSHLINAFGCSVGLNYDATVAVVGACFDTDEYIQSGKAYVFSRTGTEWFLEKTFDNPNPTYGALFGNGVAINAMGDLVLIGTPYQNSIKEQQSGSVYTYKKINGEWVSGPGVPRYYEKSIEFGSDVAVSALGRYCAVTTYKQTKDHHPDKMLIQMFENTNGVWGFVKEFEFPVNPSDKIFRTRISITFNATKLLHSSYKHTSLGMEVMVGVTQTALLETMLPYGPTITYPAHGSKDLPVNIEVTSSPFLPQELKHELTEWQLSKVPKFDSGVEGVLDYKTKTSWSLIGLARGVRYFVRARYKDRLFGYGAWGPAISFTTLPPEEAPEVFEEHPAITRFVHPDIKANAAVGEALAISGDNYMFILGVPTEDLLYKDSGSAHVYQNKNFVWIQEQEILPDPTPDVDGWFGKGVALDLHGNTCIVAQYHIAEGGALYVFNKLEEGWSLIKKLHLKDLSSVVGYSVSMSLLADVCATPILTKSLESPKFKGVAVYYIENGVWRDSPVRLRPPVDTDVTHVKTVLGLNGDCVVVRADYMDGSSKKRQLWIYRKKEGVWEEAPTIVGEEECGGGCPIVFTNDVVIDAAGKKLFCSIESGIVVLRYSVHGWNVDCFIRHPDCVVGDLFPTSIATNWNGTVLAAVCKTGETPTKPRPDSLYAFTYNGACWSTTLKRVYPSANKQSEIKAPVSLSNDGSIVSVQTLVTDDQGVTTGTVHLIHTWENFPMPVHKKPSIIMPKRGATGVPLSHVVMSSPYELLFADAAHQSTDWKISKTQYFDDILYERVDDPKNKIALEVTAPLEGINLYAMVRYKSEVDTYSEWSDPVKYTTYITPPPCPTCPPPPIPDPAPIAEYELYPANTMVAEGGNLLIEIRGTSKPELGTLYWEVVHLATAPTDFLLTGNVVTLSSGSTIGSFNVQTRPVPQFTGDKSFAVRLYTRSNKEILLASTGTLTITDKTPEPVPPPYPTPSPSPAPTSSPSVPRPPTQPSEAPAAPTPDPAETNPTLPPMPTASPTQAPTEKPGVPTYSVTTEKTSYTEGEVVNCTVATTNVVDGTVVYLTGQFVTATEPDVNLAEGLLTINGNVGRFSFTIVDDGITENAETFKVQVREDSLTGKIVASSDTVTITDKSAPTYQINSNSTNIDANQTAYFDEGQTATFTVTTTGVGNNTVLYFVVSYVTATGADIIGTTGSFWIQSNQGFFSVQIATDDIEEPVEYFKIQVKTGSSSGPVVVTTGDVGIINVSQNTQAPTEAPTELPTTSPVPVITNFTAFCFYGENVSSEWGGSFVTDTPGITYYFTLNLYEGDVTRIYEPVTPDSSGLCKVSFFTGDNTVHWSMYPIAAVRTGSRDGPILAKAPILYEGREAFPMPPDLFDAI